MSFFKKIFSGNDKPVVEDFSLLGTDVHSHLIPGIDDGSQSMEDSIKLIRGLYNLGYRKIITTPHVMSDYYRNTPEIINRGLLLLKEAVEIEKIPVEISAAAEYYVDFNFQEKIDRRELLTFGDNYVLFELSYFNPPQGIKEVVFNLQTSGYKPVLAHPERYVYWYNNLDMYEDLKDRGVLFQLNINSLSGEYSVPTKKICEKLISLGYYDMAGTDLHNEHHLEMLREAVKHKALGQLITGGKLLNSSL